MKAIFLIATALCLTSTAQAASFDQYLGNYSGAFEEIDGTLQIAGSGDALVLTFIAANGSDDILGESCQARIGKLLRMDIDKGDNEVLIDSATFAFDPGTCSKKIQGRTLEIDFKHKNLKVVGIKASILSSSYESPQSCVDVMGSRVCTGGITTYEYFLGSFKKVK